MTAPNLYSKDPSAVLDWSFDWAVLGWLASGETITARTVTVNRLGGPATPALIVNSTAVAGGVVTAWLAGGAARGAYRVTCNIVTNQGRTDERSITINVVDR